MHNKRRKFLQAAGMLTAGSMVLPHWACGGGATGQSTPATEVPAKPNNKIEQFGIQLYTLRDIIFDDIKGTLKQLAGMGYTQIEGYEGKEGLFWGMTNTDFSKYLGDIGMKMVSSHCEIKENFEEKAAQAAEIGMDYLVCPWIGPQKSMEGWKKVTEQFNACGEICRKNGIRFAYHNHAYSFKAFSGMIPHDFMMENTDPALVDHEMDIYWVVTGGADPIGYLTKYSNRFRLCHVKDRQKDVPAEEHSASCNLGAGQIDFPKILKVAKDNGMKYFLVEQEKYEGTTPMECAKVGAGYMKDLVLA